MGESCRDILSQRGTLKAEPTSPKPSQSVGLQAASLTRQLVLFLVQIDYLPFTHAIHRLSGIVTPASAAYSAQELEHQLRTSGAKAVFTCTPLLDNALKAADAVGIPRDRIFIVPVSGFDNPAPYVTIDDLVAEGSNLPPLKPLHWIKGQGARQTAYLCYSSGTSGMPVSGSCFVDPYPCNRKLAISRVLAGCLDVVFEANKRPLSRKPS